MAVTLEDFAEHIGMAGVPADSSQLERCLAAARGVIFPHLATLDPGYSPDALAVLDVCTLIVAGEFWRAKDATGGSYMFADGVDMPIYLSKDPLDSVRARLLEAGLIGLGIA